MGLNSVRVWSGNALRSQMRIDVAFKLAGVAGFVEARAVCGRSACRTDAKVPGFAGWFEFGGEGFQGRLAIGDGFDGKAFRGRFFAKVKATV